jgi:conjugal transfer ATP-binding protein TraC
MLNHYLNKLIGIYNNYQEQKTGGYTDKQIQKLVQRDRFSSLLPYDSYDDEDHYYETADDCIAFIFECLPLTYASRKTYEGLESILITLPYDSIVQATIYADDDTEPVLKKYVKLRKGQSEDFQLLANKVEEQYRKAAKDGFSNMSRIPSRIFRIFISIKIPTDTFTEEEKFLRDSVYNALRGANLEPEYVDPHKLCVFLQKIFNDIENIPNPDVWKYNSEVPVKRQIIMGGTRTHFAEEHIEFGTEKIATVQTVKEYPKDTLNDLTINKVFGGIMGQADDGNQCNFPFLCTVNIILSNLKTQIHTKTNASMIQEKKGATAALSREKEQEYLETAKEIDKNVRYVRVIPIIISFAKSKKTANENKAKIKNLWESQGFTLNSDREILNVLFLMSLPLGFVHHPNTVKWLERDRIMPARSAVRFFTIQGDYTGLGDPVTLLSGRKGQIIPIDLFDDRLAKKNGIIAAATGSGKSYLANRFIADLRTTGAIVRVFDLGDSYKKICRQLNGTYLEFTKESTICLNPYTFAHNLEESLPGIQTVIQQMIWSSSGSMPTETQATIIKEAVSKVWNDHGNEGSPTKVQQVLRNFKSVVADYGEGFDARHFDEINRMAVELAFNMSDFTTGPYKRWFDGKSTLNIDNDDFVVLELDALKSQPDLFNVVVVQVINYMANHLYQGTRDRPIFNLFDEAWQWANDKTFIGDSIVSGYRLARKYYGAFFTVFQSLNDLEKFGQSGAVMKENSAWNFLLMANNYGELHKKDLIDVDPFMLEMLKSTKLVKGQYSEVFIKSDLCSGVARLPNDKFSHLFSTSDPRDNRMIAEMAKSRNISEIQAINVLAGEA